jgi:GTP cyclohydrolase FolE2
MNRRLEDRIRRLCCEAIATENGENLTRIFAELREAVHEHVARARHTAQQRLNASLPIKERRQRNAW